MNWIVFFKPNRTKLIPNRILSFSETEPLPNINFYKLIQHIPNYKVLSLETITRQFYCAITCDFITASVTASPLAMHCFMSALPKPSSLSDSWTGSPVLYDSSHAVAMADTFNASDFETDIFSLPDAQNSSAHITDRIRSTNTRNCFNGYFPYVPGLATKHQGLSLELSGAAFLQVRCFSWSSTTVTAIFVVCNGQATVLKQRGQHLSLVIKRLSLLSVSV